MTCMSMTMCVNVGLCMQPPTPRACIKDCCSKVASHTIVSGHAEGGDLPCGHLAASACCDKISSMIHRESHALGIPTESLDMH